MTTSEITFDAKPLAAEKRRSSVERERLADATPLALSAGRHAGRAAVALDVRPRPPISPR
jgi:hypothetical protein